MKFPNSLPYRCPATGCGEVISLPATAQYADSAGDPTVAGFLVVLEMEPFRAHCRETHFLEQADPIPVEASDAG